MAEKTFIAANAYAGSKVKFAVVRYGNVVGSRGSVVPLFLNFKKQGVTEFPITDDRMTRFWITLEQGRELVLHALEHAHGGENFIPIIPSMKVVDLAKVVDPNCKIKIIGIRPGEKLHESLISEDEARKARKVGNYYVIMPQFNADESLENAYKQYPLLPEGFSYRSDNNPQWATVEELKAMIKDFEG